MLVAAPVQDGQGHQSTTSVIIDDYAANLHIELRKGWLEPAKAAYWWDAITSNVQWHRVKYKSARFGNECETPCWTSFYGGLPTFTPYEAVPSWLQPLVEKVSKHLQGVPFNAILLRLYFDGKDEIAWHTDGREFLGDMPTIASLSLGGAADFQMRRMTNVWPCAGTPDGGVDLRTSRRNFHVAHGDLLVMSKDTQKHWHHRVPKAACRRPRININFRYIIPGSPSAEHGQQTYYKYMVHGDEGPDAPSAKFCEIERSRGSLTSFLCAPLTSFTPSSCRRNQTECHDSKLAANSNAQGATTASSSGELTGGGGGAAAAPAAGGSEVAEPCSDDVRSQSTPRTACKRKGTEAGSQGLTAGGSVACSARPAKAPGNTGSRSAALVKHKVGTKSQSGLAPKRIGPLDSFFTRKGADL